MLLSNDNSSIYPTAHVPLDNISLSYCQHARETRELSPFSLIATAEDTSSISLLHIYQMRGGEEMIHLRLTGAI